MNYADTRARTTDSMGRRKKPSKYTGGMIFGKFTLLSPTVNKFGREEWLARCECGKEKIVRARNVESGHIKSCGCVSSQLRAEARTHHGHLVGGRTPTYTTWQAMLHRCTCVHSKHYPRYGGSGILVCDEWKDFSKFLADMGERPAGTTIDRIDGTKGYLPGNCRWATPGVQSANTTRAKLTPTTAVEVFKAKGQLSGRAAGKKFGVSHHVVYSIWAGKAWKEFTQGAMS